MNGTKTLRSLLLMISYFHFGFSMDKQAKKSAGLNPNAKPFHPQRQLIPNSPLSEPPTSQFISNTIQPHQQNADDPIKLPDFLFDFEENEKPIILPDSLFPWEEKEQSLSSQGANLTPSEMGSNSQSIHITPPKIGNNNQGVHLTPLEIGQLEKKQQDAHHFNREFIGGANPDEIVQSKADPVHDEEVSTYLKHGTTTDAHFDNKQNIDQSTKTFEFDQKHDITNYKRKLMTPTESISASASKSGKVKQHHLKHQSQPFNRRDKNNRTDDSGSNLTSHSHSSAHTQQQLASKIGEIITIKEIPPRNQDKAPEHVTPEIKVTKKDELNILEGQKVNEESHSIPLYNPQEQKQLEEEEKNEDNNEHKKQTKSGNNQQEKNGTSKKSKKKGKDKQKVETRNMKIKEKEDEELLEKEIENRRKEIEKQKLEEELKMKEKNEEKQQGKQKLDNVFPSSNMPLKKEVKGKQLISHPALSATPPINPTMASGSSESVVFPELASISPATIEAVAKSLSFLRKKEIERKEKLEKYNKIKKDLTKLQKKLDEIEKLEHSWLMERIEQFHEEDKNRNSNENENGEEEIQEIRIQIHKLTDANKSLGTEKGNIMELTEKMKELTSMKENNIIKLNNSINRKKKKINNKHKPVIENFYKLAEELDQTEKELLEKQKYVTDIQKQIDELQKSLMYTFIKLNNNLEPETKKIKEIQKQMEDPLKHLWIGYAAVLKILDQHWKTPEIEENSNERKPYNFISLVFICTMPENKMNSAPAELSAFENTMKLALEKMLLYQNIYRVMNFKINVNAESKSVYEKLNCFDELSKKMKMLAEKSKEIELSNNQDENIKLEVEHMKRIEKFFKDELNQKFREVLSFIIVGLDVLPEVSDQMVLNGIKELSKWLPKNRKRQMDEIWIQLFIYYDKENSIIQFLSKDGNDKDAENVFDLPPDDDDYFHELDDEVDTINNLYGRIISFGFSKEIENFMSDAFGKIKAFIQSIKILVKIEKREKHVKPLPYLKSVYEKYWYMIYKDRILPQLNSVLEYEFGREINQKERKKIIKELLDKASFERNPKVKEIFQQIALVNIDILVELMEVFDVIDKILTEIKIKDRSKKYTNDQDFMHSIRKDNPNINHYNSLWEELYGNDDSKNADLRKEIAEIAK